MRNRTSEISASDADEISYLLTLSNIDEPNWS